MIPESVLPTVPVYNALSKKAAEQSAAFLLLKLFYREQPLVSVSTHIPGYGGGD